MRITITLPDAVAEKYQQDAETLHNVLETVAAEQLIRFQDIKQLDRFVLIFEPYLGQLAEILRSLPISDVESLMTAVRRRSELKVGNIVANLSNGQIAEIRTRAEKNDRSFQEEFETIIRQAVDGLAALV